MIKVDKRLLPDDPLERSNFLHRYFGDITAESIPLNDKQFEIRLEWPNSKEFFIDPDLEVGLKWWLEDMQVVDIPKSYKRHSNYQISLFDTWSLYFWSKLVEDNPLDKVLILHVDDHDDLMVPRIGYADNRYIDLITNKPFSIYDSGSVRSAIHSGALSMGSFMSPFVFEIPRVEIRHLCMTEYAVSRKLVTQLHKAWIVDELMSPGVPKPCVHLPPVRSESFGALKYSVFSNVHHWLRGLPDGPILLHIDMDYFNNRFNGDSDWKTTGKRHDPSISDIITGIDDLFLELDKSDAKRRIINTTIALSPGFYPAEYWQESIERIDKYLKSW